MKSYFQDLAAYNHWANQTLYGSISELVDAERQKDLGGFFSSLLNTLNHILVGDLLWMERLEGSGRKPATLDTILHEDYEALKQDRFETDKRLIQILDQMPPSMLSEYLDYKTSAGVDCHDPVSGILAHIFNHQTHHRGQCHHMLSQLGKAPPPLDLIYFLRNKP